MPTATNPLPPIPPITVPVIDPAGGRMAKDWYVYLKALDRLLRALRLEIP